MTKDEKAYAIKRIQDLKQTALNTIRDQCTLPSIEIDGEAKLALIRAGKAKIRKEARVNDYGHLPRTADLFDWSAHERKRDFNAVKYDKRAEPICALAQKVSDEIMLGDGAEALRLIGEFSKTCEKI